MATTIEHRIIRLLQMPKRTNNDMYMSRAQPKRKKKLDQNYFVFIYIILSAADVI